MIKSFQAALCASSSLAVSTTQAAEAGVVATATETGGDVVITADGSYDITGLTLVNSGVTFLVNPSGINPDAGELLLLNTTADIYSGLLSVPDFGGVPGSLADLFSGGTFGVANSQLLVQTNAPTVGQVSASITFQNASFASLNMMEGSYEWGWSTDRFVLNVGDVPPPVPLPAGLPLLVGGAGALFALRRSRRA